LNLDKKVFGKTSTDFLSRYHSFEKSLRSTDSEVAVARDGICYAGLYEVTTSWYQYNPATGTLTFLSNTYSYQWQDLCLDEGIDPWAPGGNSGGTPDDDDDDDDDGAPCSNGDCDDDLALLIKWPAIKKTSNGIYLYAPTCSSSFKLKTVGNSYTMQVNKIWHAYIGGRDKFFGEYKIGSMCINVWRYKPGGGGVRSIIDTQNGLATAFDEARVETIQDWERGWISESELKSRFIARLTGQISGEFGISLGQVTVNPTPCKNIPSQPLLLKPFSSCKNYWE